MAVSKAIIFIALIFITSACFGQGQNIDSLKKILPSLQDSARVDCLNELSEQYLGSPGWLGKYPEKARLDSSEILNSKAFEEARKLNYLYGLGKSLSVKAAIAYEKYEDFKQEEKCCKEAIYYCKIAARTQGLYKTYWRLGQALYALSDFNNALNYLDTSYTLSKDAGDVLYSAGSVGASLAVCLDRGDYAGSIEKLEILHHLNASENNPKWKSWELHGLGDLYFGIEEYDSAIYYYKLGSENDMVMADVYALNKQFDSAEKYFSRYVPDTSSNNGLRIYLEDVGEYYLQVKNENKALPYFFRSLKYNQQKQDVNQIMRAMINISKTYFALDSTHSSFKFAQEALAIARHTDAKQVIRDAYKILFSLYDLWKRPDSAYVYYKQYTLLNDTLVDKKLNGKLAAYNFAQKIELLNKEKEIQQVRLQKESLQKKGFIAGAVVFLVIAFLLWRNNRHKQKAYLLLQKQKEETEIQKTKAEIAFQKLTTTQSQLIQSEKMASLGELTAGIAHEIQNPLNFVNNFSEVNEELIDEAESAILTGRIDEAKELLTSLRNNQSKINQHGKRADAIVKGMLQHSRESKGQKEPADINVLADEYLRLSYQGFRAKDKAFNVSLETNFDRAIGPINIVPQDIGLVLLNLYNNAFYAVSEKKKHLSDGYEPTVSVSTTSVDGKVKITVMDNGTGIPQNVKDKIFQPFFTTKPAGQGTGLGLSLSYDVVKANGGEIKVETRESEYTEFVVELPMSV
jgi:two-component system, NtrC family, sensor kinase